MSNDNIYERLLKLWTMTCKMIMEGTRDPYRVAEILQSIVSETKGSLRRLFMATMGATAGKYTYATARKVFSGWFDPDFEKNGIIFSGTTHPTTVVGDELMKSGKFADFLGLSISSLKKRHLLGSQLLKFCLEHPDELRGGSNITFFILTKGDKPVNDNLSNVFVAGVYFQDKGQLKARLDNFLSERTWYAESGCRLITPQL